MEIFSQEMWIVWSVPAQVSIQIHSQVGSGYEPVVHGELVTIELVPESPDYDRDVDRSPDRGCNPDVRETEFLKTNMLRSKFFQVW
jgi:hypothetical protein